MRRNLVFLVAPILGFLSCKPVQQTSESSSAKWGTTKTDRGECKAVFPEDTFHVRFKQEFQGNMGRVYGNAMTYEEGLGFNYGEKNTSTLLVKWCHLGKCVNVESEDGFLQFWKQFVSHDKKKLSIELFPERTPYEMKVAFGYLVLTVKCPQWDDR